MTHHRILLILISLLLGGSSYIYAQHLQMRGKVAGSIEIDSLAYSPLTQSPHFQKDFLAKFSRKNGRLNLNLRLDFTRLSHLKPVQSESFNSDYPQLLLWKRRQLQVKIGVILFFKNTDRSK